MYGGRPDQWLELEPWRVGLAVLCLEEGDAWTREIASEMKDLMAVVDVRP